MQVYVQNQGLELVGQISYCDSFTKAQMLRVTLVEYTAGILASQIKDMWLKIVYAAV